MHSYPNLIPDLNAPSIPDLRDAISSSGISLVLALILSWLPDPAGRFFAESVSSAQFSLLARVQSKVKVS